MSLCKELEKSSKTLKMEAASISEMSITIYCLTCCTVTEDLNLQDKCKKLKSHRDSRCCMTFVKTCFSLPEHMVSRC